MTMDGPRWKRMLLLAEAVFILVLTICALLAAPLNALYQAL